MVEIERRQEVPLMSRTRRPSPAVEAEASWVSWACPTQMATRLVPVLVQEAVSLAQAVSARAILNKPGSEREAAEDR